MQATGGLYPHARRSIIFSTTDRAARGSSDFSQRGEPGGNHAQLGVRWSGHPHLFNDASRQPGNLGPCTHNLASWVPLHALHRWRPHTRVSTHLACCTCSVIGARCRGMSCAPLAAVGCTVHLSLPSRAGGARSTGERWGYVGEMQAAGRHGGCL